MVQLIDTSAVAAPSKSEQAYAFIKARIIDGGYTPGFRLVLGQIATELAISVVPVREAIRRLEAEGLVTFERNVGAQVAMVDESAYVFVMQTLSVIEGAATALAAPNLTASDIDRARDINQQMIDSLGHFDPIRFTFLNFEFHAALFERCPNTDLLDLVRRGWNRLHALRGSTFSFVPGRAQVSVEEHETLLQLLESGADPLEIELAGRHHRTATLDAFLAHHGQPPTAD